MLFQQHLAYMILLYDTNQSYARWNFSMALSKNLERKTYTKFQVGI